MRLLSDSGVKRPFFLRPRTMAFSLILLALVCARPGAGLAHGVYIFAWTEAERLCSESYFSKKSKVRGGEVSLYDAGGGLLASGLTDEAGLACFSVPEAEGDLLFVVHAGQGHRGEFVLPAPTADKAAVADKSVDAAGQGGRDPAPAAVAAPAGQALESLIREAVREEVRRELGPLRQSLLAERADAGPGWRDILGGLGWIAGLAGLGAWYAARRRGN